MIDGFDLRICDELVILLMRRSQRNFVACNIDTVFYHSVPKCALFYLDIPLA